jgi:hypothetical protein
MNIRPNTAFEPLAAALRLADFVTLSLQRKFQRVFVGQRIEHRDTGVDRLTEDRH